MTGSASLLADAKLFEISPQHVDEGARIGFLHEDKAAALGRLMAVDGQRDPIKVVANPKNPDKPWRLVTGMHRLIGARIEGITVWAIEVSGKPEALADLEASENKHRRTLSPIEDAKFVAALTKAAQERIARNRGGLKQQELAIRARWARVKSGEQRADEALRDEVQDTLSDHATAYGADAVSWEKAVDEAFGMGRDAIYRALRLYRFIVEPFPGMAEALSRHPIVGANAKQLREIADVTDEVMRKAVIEALLEDDELTVAEVKVRLGIGMTGAAQAATPVAHQKFHDQITGGWQRLNTAEKRRFLPTMVSMLTPEMKREMRDRLDAELGETAPSGADAATKDAISTAFDVIAALAIGDAVDDDQIETARAKLQEFLVDHWSPADAR
jgi:ParB family transcriptional regulator, chromosome partitioning protein